MKTNRPPSSTFRVRHASKLRVASAAPTPFHWVHRIGLVAASVFVLAVNATEIKGRVVGVSDGDTIVVLDGENRQHRTRLAGIDAPEKRQAFGQRSKESLSELVFNREVTVETSKKDRYGREVGKVFVDGLDANLEQIKRGMAWHYKAYQREQSAEDRAAYTAAEEEAKMLRKGLWQDVQPVAPWEFRRMN